MREVVLGNSFFPLYMCGITGKPEIRFKWRSAAHKYTHYLDLPDAHCKVTKDEISKKETDVYAKIPKKNEDIYEKKTGTNLGIHETKACNIHTLGRTQLIPRPVNRCNDFFCRVNRNHGIKKNA